MKTISMAALGALVVVAACADTDPLGPDIPAATQLGAMGGGGSNGNTDVGVLLGTTLSFCSVDGTEIRVAGSVTASNNGEHHDTESLSVAVILEVKPPSSWGYHATSGPVAGFTDLAPGADDTRPFVVEFDPTALTHFRFEARAYADNINGGHDFKFIRLTFSLPTGIPDCNGAVIERRGIGYWKNHEAETEAGLPVTIGDVEVATFAAANAILDMATGPSWNGIEKLMAQLLAAELNGSIGACGFSEIAATVTAAQAFLDGKASDPATAWSLLTEAQKDGAEELKDQLDEWNNGSCS
jgi:hypothetical protein